jgi:ATP-dependent 26S proteasome regulatory subunit
VSRRILSTLLRKIDSFESENETLLICATNRKEDLDKAILSRIDLSIKFDLPDVHSRREIFRRYAKHLDQGLLDQLADRSTNMSGRNIYEICKDAERRWASKRIRKEVEQPFPPFDQYVESLNQRVNSQLS